MKDAMAGEAPTVTTRVNANNDLILKFMETRRDDDRLKMAKTPN
jgi:hypothetical protein